MGPVQSRHPCQAGVLEAEFFYQEGDLLAQALVLDLEPGADAGRRPGMGGDQRQARQGEGLENPGANADGSDCNPTEAVLGCSGNGANRPLEERQGPDPTNPLLTPETQFENPYNQGSITSSYIMFTLGFSKNW